MLVPIVARHDARRELERERLLHDGVQQDERLRPFQRLADRLSAPGECVEHARVLERLQQEEGERVRVRAAARDDGPVGELHDAFPEVADRVREERAHEAPERDDPDGGELAHSKLRAHLLDYETGKEERGAELGYVPDGLVIEIPTTGHDVACEEGE